MKKLGFCGVLVMVLLLSSQVMAADVGDIYYSDKTFSAELVKGKKPIGMVYWTSPAKDFGLIMQLEQPMSTMNHYEASQYCNEYFTEGTMAGDWRLPRRMEQIRMGEEQILGVKNGKFATLNAKLPQIKVGETVLGQALLGGNKYYRTDSQIGYVFYLGTGGFSTVNTDDSPTNGNRFYVRCITAF